MGQPAGRDHWDTELYEARHSFVWEYGRELIALLNPQPGERILDVGCGTGQLTAQLAASGADVTGLDSSPAMIGQARQHYPFQKFVLADAAQMQFETQFDAVFSNAALHWMPDIEAVADSFARVLKPGGRVVVECGGRGNIRTIENTIASAFKQLGRSLPRTRTVFRSISALSGVFEASGLEVTSASLFDRPTQLDGLDGMANWLRQFSAYYFDVLPPEERQSAYKRVVDLLRPALFNNGLWYADYRRLRLIASKVTGMQ